MSKYKQKQQQTSATIVTPKQECSPSDDNINKTTGTTLNDSMSNEIHTQNESATITGTPVVAVSTGSIATSDDQTQQHNEEITLFSMVRNLNENFKKAKKQEKEKSKQINESSTSLNTSETTASKSGLEKSESTTVLSKSSTIKENNTVEKKITNNNKAQNKKQTNEKISNTIKQDKSLLKNQPNSKSKRSTKSTDTVKNDDYENEDSDADDNEEADDSSDNDEEDLEGNLVSFIFHLDLKWINIILKSLFSYFNKIFLFEILLEPKAKRKALSRRSVSVSDEATIEFISKKSTTTTKKNKKLANTISNKSVTSSNTEANEDEYNNDDSDKEMNSQYGDSGSRSTSIGPDQVSSINEDLNEK